MNPFDKIIELLRELPGIGPRQAKRFAYFFLGENKSYLKDFSETLLLIKDAFSQCHSCMRFFKKNGKNENLCFICKDESRNNTELLVVAKDIDLENIEKSSAFKGQYFILGNLFSLTAMDGRDNSRMAVLKKKIEEMTNLKEIIFALSATTEGDHTELILTDELREIADKKNVKFLRLGKGLSTGVELEYADKDTIAGALKNKTPAL